MELHLAGKRALITGGSRGIGLAVAELLARQGARVMIAARSQEQVTAAVEAINASVGQQTVWGRPFDIKDRESIQSLVAACTKELGGVDILVNSSSGALSQPNPDMTDEEWRDALNYKLLGYIRVVTAAFPIMRDGGGGSIVNVIGGTGREPYDWTSSSGVVNAGLLSYTKTTARQFAPYNIRVNAVNPRQIDTVRLTEFRAVEPEGYARTTSEIPLGRLGTPQDVAPITVFLASELAAFITGTAIDVDGGATHSVAF